MNIVLLSHGSSDPQERFWKGKILRHKLDEQANVSPEFRDMLRDAINEIRPVTKVELRKPDFDKEGL